MGQGHDAHNLTLKQLDLLALEDYVIVLLLHRYPI